MDISVCSSFLSWTILQFAASLHFADGFGQYQINTSLISSEVQLRGMECCRHHKMDEECVHICSADKDDKIFIGHMLCKYRYAHIQEACKSGMEPNYAKPDLRLFRNLDIIRNSQQPSSTETSTQTSTTQEYEPTPKLRGPLVNFKAVTKQPIPVERVTPGEDKHKDSAATTNKENNPRDSGTIDNNRLYEKGRVKGVSMHVVFSGSDGCLYHSGSHLLWIVCVLMYILRLLPN